MAKQASPQAAIKPLAITVAAPVDQFAHTDQGNAHRFIAALGRNLRYDHKRQQWFKWGEHYWRQVEESVVLRAAMKLVSDTYEAAKQRGHEELKTWMRRSEDGGHIYEIVRRARVMNPTAIESDCWNRDPFLFAVTNGVIDLRTSEFRAGKRADYIDVHSPVTYDPTAICPTVDKFIEQITCQRKDLEHYLDKALGYSLTGDTRERCLFILWGAKGNNGKTSLSELMAYVIGDYGKTVPSEMLSAKRNDGPRNDLARLVDARFVHSGETELRHGVAEAMLKLVTGRDTITVRFLHKEFFEYRPQFHIWFHCNRLPPIRSTENPVWCRIPVIPFDAEFRGEDEIKDLDQRLQAEASGFLNRLIRGCIAWQEEGLERPQCMNDLAAMYRSEANPIAPFLEVRCEYALPQPDATTCKTGVSMKTLWDTYVNHCHKVKEKPETFREFNNYMRAFGFADARCKRGQDTVRYWPGINLYNGDSVQVDGLPDPEFEA
jgi:putative DNA primase/helicase